MTARRAPALTRARRRGLQCRTPWKAGGVRGALRPDGKEEGSRMLVVLLVAVTGFVLLLLQTVHLAVKKCRFCVGLLTKLARPPQKE